MEGLAEAGGICISGTVYDSIKNKLTSRYESIGEHMVKNIKDPVRVYRMRVGPAVVKGEKTPWKILRPMHLLIIIGLIVIVGTIVNWHYFFRHPSVEPASVDKMAYPLPDKPSIAVMPFTNMSGDPAQDYIADGLSENIIDALSVSSMLFVISRTSTFAYKGKPVKVQQVAEDLGVQYILEGSIQKSGEHLRVTAQLIDALSGHHLWSEKYDRDMKELFDLQDEITKNIVVSVRAQLTSGESSRMTAKKTRSLEAFKHQIQGKERMAKLKKEDIIKAKEHFNEAIRLDPNYPDPYYSLALCNQLEVRHLWSASPKDSSKRAFELAQKAVAMDDQYAPAHALLGDMYLYRGEHEKALSEEIKAITLNPNYGHGYALLGATMLLSGRFEESIEMINTAYRLNPFLPPFFKWPLIQSNVFLGRYKEAIEVARTFENLAQKNRLPAWMPPLDSALIYQEMGQEEDAKAYMSKALKLYPQLSVKWYKMNAPYRNPDHLLQIINALRRAGLPEEPRKVTPQ